MAKRRPNEQRAQLSFQRPEDLRLYEFLAKRAYEARYEIGTFILVSLHEAFKGQIEDEEVSALAEEAVRKVQYRTKTLTFDGGSEMHSPIIFTPEPPPVKQPLSMDQAAKQAEAQIASLDAVAAKAMKKRVVRKGVPSPPPLPE